MSEDKKPEATKIDYSFTEKDLNDLGFVFTLARQTAANTAGNDRELMANLLNFEGFLTEKIMRTFTPEQLEALKKKSEESQNEELEDFKQS